MTTTAIDTLKAPDEVKRALTTLVKALEATGAVTGVVLYGGLARGRYVPHQSDVNLVVLLRDGAPATLGAIAAPLKAAWRAARVEPFLLTFDEVARSADVFPTKFRDLREHHVVLSGQSPFADLEVSSQHLRLRVEQELRNLSLRLRRRAIAAWGDDADLERTLQDVSSGLALELGLLLELLGQPRPGLDDIGAVLEATARAVGVSVSKIGRAHV
jgi:predicted nucleotidyltransferase